VNLGLWSYTNGDPVRRLTACNCTTDMRPVTIGIKHGRRCDAPTQRIDHNEIRDAILQHGMVPKDAGIQHTHAHALALGFLPKTGQTKLLQTPGHAAAYFLLGKLLVLDALGLNQVNALVG